MQGIFLDIEDDAGQGSRVVHGGSPEKQEQSARHAKERMFRNRDAAPPSETVNAVFFAHPPRQIARVFRPKTTGTRSPYKTRIFLAGKQRFSCANKP